MSSSVPHRRRRRSTASAGSSTPARRAPAASERAKAAVRGYCVAAQMDRAQRRVARPRRSGRTWRLPRAAASAISSTRHSSTSTPASMLPAAPSKVTWNCWKIATVKVSNRTIANAPNSASRCTPINRPPPRIASRSCGSTTRKNTPARIGSQRAGRFLDGGVEPAQRRGGGKVHEGEVRQRRDQARPPTARAARESRRPRHSC